MAMLIDSNKPMMLVGKTGTGKSAYTAVIIIVNILNFSTKSFNQTVGRVMFECKTFGEMQQKLIVTVVKNTFEQYLSKY